MPVLDLDDPEIGIILGPAAPILIGLHFRHLAAERLGPDTLALHGPGWHIQVRRPVQSRNLHDDRAGVLIPAPHQEGRRAR